MIIPCDPIISKKMKYWGHLQWKLYRSVAFYLQEYCDDDVMILLNTTSEEIWFDVPEKGGYNGTNGRSNGGSAVIDFMNYLWTYDPGVENVVAQYKKNSFSEWCIVIRFCNNTKSLNKEYLNQVLPIQKRRNI